MKFSAVEAARGGLTIPVRGVGGSWIVKLPSREFESVPEDEFAMMTLARLIGMDIPAIQLIDLDAMGNLPEGIGALNGQALAIERFDRLEDGTLVHIEDFARIFGVYPENKYKKASASNIANVIAAEGSDVVSTLSRAPRRGCCARASCRNGRTAPHSARSCPRLRPCAGWTLAESRSQPPAETTKRPMVLSCCARSSGRPGGMSRTAGRLRRHSLTACRPVPARLGIKEIHVYRLTEDE